MQIKYFSFMLSGMITGAGISQVQKVNLKKPRNMFVLGLSVFLGLSLPNWIRHNKHAIDTGKCTRTDRQTECIHTYTQSRTRTHI